MTNRDTKDYLRDILDYSNDAIEFTRNITFEQFKKNKKTVYAVARTLEIVGEATRKVPNSFRNENPNIPWKKITSMRDKLIHDYTGVDLDIVWKTATKFVPLLKKEIEKIIWLTNMVFLQETKAHTIHTNTAYSNLI